MKIKKSVLLDLWNGLHAVGELPGVKFAYGVSKNIVLLTSEMNSLAEAITPSAEFKVFEKERLELAKNAAKKVNGVPETIKDGKEYNIENKESFALDIEALKATHQEAVKGREEQFKQYNELLAEEMKVILHMVKLGDVPADITPMQLSSIMSIIEE